MDADAKASVERAMSLCDALENFYTLAADPPTIDLGAESWREREDARFYRPRLPGACRLVPELTRKVDACLNQGNGWRVLRKLHLPAGVQFAGIAGLCYADVTFRLGMRTARDIAFAGRVGLCMAANDLVTLEAMSDEEWLDAWPAIAARLGEGPPANFEQLFVCLENEGQNLAEHSSDQMLSGTSNPLDEAEYLAASDLAKRYGVDYERLRGRLDTFRLNSDTGYREVQNRKRNDPKYVYLVGAVRHIIDALKSPTNPHR